MLSHATREMFQGKADKDAPLSDWVFKVVPLFVEETSHPLCHSLL